ncbi:MBL fold metallo-hydrolase [Atrimonas thermophila]|uniref:MBL fold metallo-hydrolase n=1 Tax=Atrimonas thermophila TaxID=3064161 RepID=UPI00399CE50D
MRKYLFLGLLFFFLLCSASAFAETLRVYFLDVGQGDASLIVTSTGEVVLIDSGPSEGTILNHLSSLGVTHIDLVIVSHPHADHITGMDKVIDIYKPRAYMDPGVLHTTRTYERVLQAVKRNNIKYYQATGRRIKLGPMLLTVLPPGHFGDLNNDSAVVRLDFLEFSCLFTGDIEREREEELIRVAKDKLDVDILKIPHHGSSTGTTIAFLKATTPEVAVISCGRGNKYGHPHAETLQALQSMGIAVYRTDLNGTILVKTDGKTYEVIPERGEPRGPPEEAVVAESDVGPSSDIPTTATETATYQYVASKNSSVFHYPWCSYAQKIKPENKIYFSTREEAVASGRRPCKVCKP